MPHVVLTRPNGAAKAPGPIVLQRIRLVQRFRRCFCNAKGPHRRGRCSGRSGHSRAAELARVLAGHPGGVTAASGSPVAAASKDARVAPQNLAEIVANTYRPSTSYT
jgi:hypothetical protein